MLQRTARIIVPPILKLMSAGQVNSARDNSSAESSKWATPLQLPGVPNLHRLNNDLYRSGQPTPAGFQNLERELGIRSCLSLRTHRRDDGDAIGTAVLCKSMPLLGVIVTDNDIVEAMVDICHKLPRPILIHCYQGSDRTGLFCAAYRILVESWSKEEAIREMVCGGFGFHELYSSFVAYLSECDVPKLKARLDHYASTHAHQEKKH